MIFVATQFNTGNQRYFPFPISPGRVLDLDGKEFLFQGDGTPYLFDVLSKRIYRVDPVSSLLNQGTQVGTDIPVTTTNANPSGSIFYPSTTVPALTPDTRNGTYRCLRGSTNLVSNILTNWTVTIGSLTVTNPETDVYRITVNNPGSTSVLDFSIPPASLDRTCNFGIRKVSGVLPSSDFVAFVDNNTPKGSGLSLDELTTTDWKNETITASSSDFTNRVRFRFNADTVAEIEVRMMRAVDSAIAHGPHPPGTGAGNTQDTDVLSCSPVFTSESSIVQIATPYGWGPLDNPASITSPRLFDMGGVFFAFADSAFDPNGYIAFFGQGGTTQLRSTQTLSPDTPLVACCDANGTSIGLRVNSETRITTPDTNTFTGRTLHVGNNPAGVRIFQGDIETWIFPFVLTGAQYELVRQYLLAKRSGLAVY